VTLRLSLSVRVATLGDLKHNGIRPSPRFGQAAGPRPGRWPSGRRDEAFARIAAPVAARAIGLILQDRSFSLSVPYIENCALRLRFRHRELGELLLIECARLGDMTSLFAPYRC
jgi:hypothetical protein